MKSRQKKEMAMGISVRLAKRQGYHFSRKFADCCPSCKTHFKKKKIKILWRDVVECSECGNIWVVIDLGEFLKWA